MAYENIIVETRGNVGLITLNRPEALNALSSPLMADLTEALDTFEADDSIGAMVLTGSEKGFCGRRGHQGNAEQNLDGSLPRRFHHRGLGTPDPLPQTGDSGGRRLRPWGGLRSCHDV